MEENNTLFSLSIDPITKSHLTDAAKWGKFLAIIGFISCVLVVVGGIFFASYFSSMSSRSIFDDTGGRAAQGMGAAMAFVYVIIAVIYFFPCLFLYRFSSRMKAALASNGQDELNTSFQNLKILFRYMGILTIIVIAFYALTLVVIGVGALSS